MLGNSRGFKPELFVQSIFMLLLCLISWEILFTMNKNVSLEWKRAPMILSLTRGGGGGGGRGLPNKYDGDDLRNC